MAQILRFSNLKWLNFNSKSSTNYPILINTTGYFNFSSPFETYNPVGRDDYYLIYIVEGELFVDIDGKNHCCTWSNLLGDKTLLTTAILPD